ncbi:MAG: PAS domain S-box protein, partial [Sphingobacteriales bacterium]
PDRQLLGKPILEALPEIENNSVYHSFRQVYETGITHEEHEMLIPFARPGDGVLENRYFRYTQQARTSESGQVDGILVFAYEVTEHVKARIEVEASAQQLRLIADALPVLISYIDSDRKYQFANNAYKEWFNMNPDQMVGKPVIEILGKQAYQNAKQHMDKALAGEKATYEAKMPYRENLVKHIRASYVPERRNGIVLGFYALVTDVTDEVEARSAMLKSAEEARVIAEELARANESLRLTNQQLLHTNHDLDNFIYTASHDLRAPISNIEMLMQELFSEFPEDTLQQPDVKKIVRHMESAIERFKKTIGNLTEITKLQKDNLTEARLLNLEDVIEDVKLDLAPLIKESDVEIQTNITH